MTVGLFQPNGGWIEVIAGVMFSGKSEELIRRVRRALIARKHVQVFKSHLDDRYAGVYKIGSHDGRTIEATQAVERHVGRDWQRWSRHFIGGQWQSGTDSLESFIALIQREVTRCTTPK